MGFSLRGRILLFTVLPPVALTAATLWTVNRDVTRQAHERIHEGLIRASRLFEDMLASRSEGLGVSARSIARDPRFFSLLDLDVPGGDPRFRATVRVVARDFNAIAGADLFEVFDRRGRLLASAGRVGSAAAGRAALVGAALSGTAAAGVLADGAAPIQAVATRVEARGRPVGVLLLGAAIGEDLARELRNLTYSDVTFLVGRDPTGSTIEGREDRESLRAALETLAPGAGSGGPVEIRRRGETVLTLARRIPGSPEGARLLYVMQRSLDAETAFLRGIRGGLERLGVAAALLALVFGLFVAERIARPVRRLVRAAAAMEAGDYEAPLGRVGRDEIGDLAERFAEMRRRERAHVHRLQEVVRLKTEFINVASHELRTPISVIRGYHELFADGSLGPVAPAARRALAGIGGSLAELTRVAEDATRMAETEEGETPREVEREAVEAIVERAIEAASRDAGGRDVAVAAEVEPDLPPAPVDGERLARAIAELVRNGVRFTPDGGRVTIAARRDREWLAIEVRDTGIGMAEEKRDQLLRGEPGARLASPPADGAADGAAALPLAFNAPGPGRGLAVARGLVRDLDGEMAVESRPGEGSVFAIRIPAFLEDRLDEAA